MLEELLWRLEKIMKQLMCDSALKRLILNDDVGEKLLVEYASVRAPFLAIPQHDHAPIRQGRPDRDMLSTGTLSSTGVI